MKDKTKHFLKELFSHGVSFGSGMLLEKLIQKKIAPDIENRINKLSVKDREDVIETLNNLKEILIVVASFSHAMAIFFGVGAEAIRRIPELAKEIDLSDESIDSLKKTIYSYAFERMTKSYSSSYAQPIFKIAATVISFDVKNAVKSPNVFLSDKISSEVYNEINSMFGNIKLMKETEVYAIIKQFIPDLERVSNEWKNEGKPEIYFYTIQNIIKNIH